MDEHDQWFRRIITVIVNNTQNNTEADQAYLMAKSRLDLEQFDAIGNISPIGQVKFITINFQTLAETITFASYNPTQISVGNSIVINAPDVDASIGISDVISWPLSRASKGKVWFMHREPDRYPEPFNVDKNCCVFHVDSWDGIPECYADALPSEVSCNPPNGYGVGNASYAGIGQELLACCFA